MVFPLDRRKKIDQPKGVLISINPNAGSSSGQSDVEKLEKYLVEAGFDVVTTSDIDEVAETSSMWASSNHLRAVVAAGGDGTASLIADRTNPLTPIAILPQGTENLLAKYLQIKPDPATVADLIIEGETIDLDAGRANGRLFLIMLGCGFDAEVVRRLDEARSGHIHHLAYAKPILQSIFNYDYPDIRIEELSDDGERLDCIAKWAFVVNLPRYAVGLRIAPSAQGTDELLDLCAFREGSFLSGLTYLTGVILGKHENWEDCIRKQASRFRLTSEQPVPFQVDGDPGGYLPVEIEVIPRRLRVYASPEFINS